MHHAPPAPSWHQLNISFDTPHTAEQTFATHLGPALLEADNDGMTRGWFFIRKQPWRLRYQPTSALAAHQTALLLHRALQEAQQPPECVEAIYEPETHAFGGEQAMALAHDLFHRDSRHTLHHLRTPPTSGDKRREVSILACTALMRAAGLDWFEQGDVWARVAHLRPPHTATPTQTAALHRLLTVDTTPVRSSGGALEFAHAWITDFETAGDQLADLARQGNLTRGLRAVIAHHILFHWNRLGLDRTTQSSLAHTARSAILDQ